jgi:predicted transcriptional regulator
MEQISIRLDPELSARADSLVATLADRPEFKAFRTTRAAILRMAMLEGLAVLEQRYPGPPQPEKAKRSKR